MKDPEHFVELMLLYDTTDAEELMLLMTEDLNTISKAIKRERKRDDYNGLNFARIGADNWK